MNAFDTLNYVEISIDDVLWDLKYDYENENWNMIWWYVISFKVWFMIMMSKEFHEMFIDLWKWYVVESMEHEYEHKWEKCIRD
jgi:hypothetical protein